MVRANAHVSAETCKSDPLVKVCVDVFAYAINQIRAGGRSLPWTATKTRAETRPLSLIGIGKEYYLVPAGTSGWT